MAKDLTTNRHVAASIHEDGVVLLHTRRGRVFASNRVGARIWHALERRQPPAVITRGITDHYGIPHERAASEVAGFLTQLEQHGLLERSIGR